MNRRPPAWIAGSLFAGLACACSGASVPLGPTSAGDGGGSGSSGGTGVVGIDGGSRGGDTTTCTTGASCADGAMMNVCTTTDADGACVSITYGVGPASFTCESCTDCEGAQSAASDACTAPASGSGSSSGASSGNPGGDGGAADGSSGGSSGTGGGSGSGGSPDAGSSTAICPEGSKYELEAAAAVAKGTETLCPSDVCGAGQCCYVDLSPANICVAE